MYIFFIPFVIHKEEIPYINSENIKLSTNKLFTTFRPNNFDICEEKPSPFLQDME